MSTNVSSYHHETSQISRHPSPLLFPSVSILIFIGILLAIFLTSCTSDHASDPSSIVQTAYDRLNKGDVDGFMELVSEDAVFIDTGGGRHVGSQDLRKVFEDMVKSHFRVELSDLSADGNVVTFTAAVYQGDQLVGTFEDAIDIIANGQIIFDGTKGDLEQECKSHPDQAFCLGQ